MSSQRARSTTPSAAPSPRSASPPRDWPRLASLGLAAVGALDAAYLTWVKLAGLRPFCGSTHACDTVNTSLYSEIGGVPIALLGLGAYLVIAGLILLEPRARGLASWARLAVFGMALTGTLYSAYLTYVELYVLNAVCPYCVVSAVCIAGLLVLAVVRVARAPAG